MSYSLRTVGAELIASLASSIWYVVNIWQISQVRAVELFDVAKFGAIAIGISIGMSIVLSILSAMVDHNTDTDERDKQIARRGNASGGYVLSAALFLAIGYVFYLGFWGDAESISLVTLSHGLLFAGFSSSVVGLVVKITGYVRGY